MVDIVSPEKRSRMMSGIRGKNTRIELNLRKGLYALGYRYRLHVASLPGKPDIVFRNRNAVLFAHGCFWHGHDCHLFRMPATRTDFWREKIAANVKRDTQAQGELEAAGWRVGIVWECAVKGRTRIGLERSLELCARWLDSDKENLEVRGQE